MLRRAVQTVREPWSFWRARPNFHFMDLEIAVTEGVLNPTLFTASKVFARQVSDWLPTETCDLLEMGCGCGLTSLVAAQKGHRVWAADIDPVAVANTLENASRNQLHVEALESNWDADFPAGMRFDRVVCNPPFLPVKTPRLSRALHAGDRGEFLAGMMAAFARRIRPGGKALLMTSSQGEVAGYWQEALLDHPGLKHRHLAAVRHWQERLLFDEFTMTR